MVQAWSRCGGWTAFMVSENEPTIPTNIAITSVIDDDGSKWPGRVRSRGQRTRIKHGCSRGTTRQDKTRQVTYAAPWHKDDAPLPSSRRSVRWVTARSLGGRALGTGHAGALRRYHQTCHIGFLRYFELSLLARELRGAPLEKDCAVGQFDGGGVSFVCIRMYRFFFLLFLNLK